jgi:protein-L-isoaspartate O-methyltransferase
MHAFESFQQELLRKIKYSLRKPLAADLEQVFLSTPRHLFVKKFYEPKGEGWEAVIIDNDNLALKLPQLYHDSVLTLVVDEDNSIPSTISQPSFVIYMLDKLQLREGHSVLEIGAASGWNAAMMGKLAGDGGNVYSVEIIPELAKSAEANIVSLGMANVHIITGDGGEGYALKNKGYGDNLVLFKKVDGHFESIDNSASAFVSLRGKYQMSELKAIEITQRKDSQFLWSLK